LPHRTAPSPSQPIDPTYLRGCSPPLGSVFDFVGIFLFPYLFPIPSALFFLQNKLFSWLSPPFSKPPTFPYFKPENLDYVVNLPFSVPRKFGHCCRGFFYRPCSSDCSAELDIRFSLFLEVPPSAPDAPRRSVEHRPVLCRWATISRIDPAFLSRCVARLSLFCLFPMGSLQQSFFNDLVLLWSVPFIPHLFF